MTEDKSGDNENDNAFDDEIQLYCHLIWQLIKMKETADFIYLN